MAKVVSAVEKINYYPGTFDTEIYKQMKDAILSSSITFVEIEGSIRAGKDVLALNCYAQFLMMTPDRLHLVTHVTMASAKATVYDADGFGLKNLIPHGEMVCDDNRYVFKFKDWNGLDKEVHFFGLSQINDHEKFRGISYGSHYANEATRQNVAGLKNAKDRTVAAKWRKIIYTQNPVSPSNPFYSEIEAPLIATPQQVAKICADRDAYRKEYEKVKRDFEIKETAEKRRTIKTFLFEHKKTDVEFLSKSENLSLRKELLLLKYNIRHQRESYLFDNYGITSKNYVFYEGGDNPNNVKNGLNFRYFHLTMDNNLAIDNVRKEETKSSYDPSSLHYKRDILGIRALSDGAIYDNLTNENYYYTDLPKVGLMDLGWERVLAIDYGVKNDFVILDCFIAPYCKILFVEDEMRFKGNSETELRPATNELYVQMVKEMIAKRENGRYTALLYDPSARPFANTMAVNNIRCQRANNTVKRSKRVKKLDLENQDQKLYKENNGIMLVKSGFGLNKIRINKRNCADTVLEIEGYSYDPKKLAVGIEEPLKIKDHGCIVGESLISTINGKKQIKDIKVGDILLTMNEKTNKLEYDTVEDCMLTGKNVEVYELELESGEKLVCTADHKILTTCGRKELTYLTKSDILLVKE